MFGRNTVPRRSLLVTGALGLLVAAGGCGAAGAGRAAGQSSPSTTVPDGAQSTTTGPSRVPDEDGVRGRVVVATPGAVTVIAVKGDILGAGGISAVVVNGTAGDIFVQDLRTACSIAVVERRTDAAQHWQPLHDCGAERLAAVLAIAPGHGRTVRIDPQSLASAGSPLVPGTYRLTVPWRTTPQPGAEADNLARSALFVVR